ncbi:MAG: DEAD/DEAH box helicase family protein [Verrucomicrobiales bacterium]
MAKKSKNRKPKRPRQRRKRAPGEGRDFRYRTVFVGGKQKRIREELVEGVPVEDFLRDNADEVFLQQSGMLEEWHPQQNSSEPLPASIDDHSPPEEKIALFRSLFRGRGDLYARRFESRTTGKTGYAPACGNEWVRGVCEKPRVKCADCSHRKFLPVTDEAVRRHLTGTDDNGAPFVMGAYPLLEDETCWFLALDFDKADWRTDAAAFLETCREREIPAALERSRSGNGGHVWIFFADPLPARVARQFGSFLITETMRRHPDLGFASYDRLFPNQDTMPRGGFGNLIALPLQKAARGNGNSVFLDAEGGVIEDQWKFLGGIERVSPGTVYGWVERAEKKQGILDVRRFFEDDEDTFALEPWAAPPSRKGALPKLPEGYAKTLRVVLGDGLYIDKDGLHPALRNQLLRLAAFQNPEFHKAQAMRLSTYGKPRVVHCAEDGEHFLVLPRGCLDSLLEVLKRLRITPEIEDRRNEGEPLDVNFDGTLRPDQERAGNDLIAHDIGVLAATTAFGKTVLAAWLIARRGVNTLVLVHRQQLMEQWVDRLSTFLDFPGKEIGRLGGGRKKLRGKIDVALVQSLVRKGEVDDRIAGYGQVIVDECHHISARSFELAASRAKAKYVVGLSATVVRKDGHHPVIFMQCGPVRHRVGAAEQGRKSSVPRTVIVRPTPFGDFAESGASDECHTEFRGLCEMLIEDRRRNEMICADIAEAVRDGRSPLVLTERNDHLATLLEMLEERNVPTFSLQGGMKKKALRATLDAIAEESGTRHRAIVATGKFVGEGFDEARLDTLFLTMPVSWKGTIAQYAGRLHRSHAAKKEIRVFDYADLDVPMFARMFEKRRAGYESIGYTVTVPASALPGWPAEVPLPMDDRWKHRHSESTRRLVRDGVDVQLANLFADAAGVPAAGAPAAGAPEPIPPGATGESRARSASEAFLFRRLETLPETAGRFRVNETVPIPYGQANEMEVDFLDRESRLVIEIDGDQHLGDVLAYRRDRHKDAQLQSHGYLVLRFLATDLGERLDQILDAILRAVALRRRQFAKDEDDLPF